MTSKVLVAYSSKYGSTKEISSFIGENLRKKGIQVDVSDVRDIHSLTGYDAFVVGSALYMGHWMKEARQFVSKNSKAMLERPVWLFSSGPVGTKTTDAKGRNLLEVSGPAELDELKNAVKPRDHRVFFGAFDSTRLTGTYSFFYKLALRSQAARESMAEGDFRNWKEIEAWTDSIAGAVVGSSAS
jgi:menaquinone-dependent protoporphyrinogen oxidase